MEIARSAVTAVGLALVAGCTSIPDRILLETPKSSHSLAKIDMRDARPMDSLAAARSGSGLSFNHRFGDDQFEPNVLVVLRTRLASELGSVLENKVVTVTGVTIAAIQTAKVGGVISVIENARADRYVFCAIEATVDGRTVSGTGQKYGIGGTEIGDAVKVSVRDAITDLIGNIRVKLAAPKENPDAAK